MEENMTFNENNITEQNELQQVDNNDVLPETEELTKERKGARFLLQVANGGKNVANGVAKKTKEIADKLADDGYQRRLKKYNPLFPEVYFGEGFFLPNIIMIVDDAVRRDIDVCKGAIGWREKRNDTEILCLYDEFVNDCGLKFIPAASCDEIYYVDVHDRKRFIRHDCIFQQSHAEKVAELEHIAYSLGAKKCEIVFEETQVQHFKRKKGYDFGYKRKGGSDKNELISVGEDVNREMEIRNSESSYRKSEAYFEGNSEVTEPRLKWFANDDNIRNLIEYRYNKENRITSKTLELSEASSATLGKKAAHDIDTLLKSMKVSQEFSLEEKAINENQTKIRYHLEF
ncbi:MAG: hypothetical protein IKN24_07705 [Lachnospiraceae bacterium]|nr:hypothetical protein [Lachnospiraceae bacterium]